MTPITRILGRLFGPPKWARAYEKGFEAGRARERFLQLSLKLVDEMSPSVMAPMARTRQAPEDVVDLRGLFVSRKRPEVPE